MQYLAIRYTERLAANGVVNSVGSRGDSYDNALAESMFGLYKTELVRPRGPWRGLDDLELATLEWVDWFNHRRLFEDHGRIPPAEFEDRYYRQELSGRRPRLTPTSLRETRGGSQSVWQRGSSGSRTLADCGDVLGGIFFCLQLLSGFMVGALARLALPGPDPMPFWFTVLVGMFGAIIGGVIAGALFGATHAFDNSNHAFVTLLLAVGAAIVILAAYRRLVQRRPLSGPDAHRFPSRGLGIERMRARLRQLGIDPDQLAGRGRPEGVSPKPPDALTPPNRWRKSSPSCAKPATAAPSATRSTSRRASNYAATEREPPPVLSECWGRRSSGAGNGKGSPR